VLLQIINFRSQGGHLPIPERHKIPGQDTHAFKGLDAYIDLMKRCLAQVPEERPSFDEIIKIIR
jgi:hypothetical protein